MARAHFVNSARKSYKDAGIKKGDSYWWWKFRFGGKRMSKTKPRNSQLTQSEFLGTLYDLQERKQPAFGDLESERDSIKEELEQLRDEQEEKKSNMPESLQESNTGELLQERYDSLDEAVGALECIEIPSEDEIEEELKDEHETEHGGGTWAKLSDDDRNQKIGEKQDEVLEEKWGEVTEALSNISCG